jgi:DNA helicase-2/ATP-dependent DNA helicase PcrA
MARLRGDIVPPRRTGPANAVTPRRYARRDGEPVVTSDVELSDEQRRIVAHGQNGHARVLAGPGSGKSFTATYWLGSLLTAERPPRAKMLTFTRAATAESAEKLSEADLADKLESPATVHSHALSVLMGMDGHGLPAPLRIPDTWETKQLIRRYLSRLLKTLGYDAATPGLVQQLESEMATGWETLDETFLLLTKVDPALRAAYVNAWQAHRAAFGYSLLAELPYRAGMALEDLGEDHPPKVDLLLVDE